MRCCSLLCLCWCYIENRAFKSIFFENFNVTFLKFAVSENARLNLKKFDDEKYDKDSEKVDLENNFMQIFFVVS